jgi:hypothetical protein
MAIAFIRGTVTREPYFKAGDKTPFAALSLKETYTDREGEERLGGYHDIVAFGEDAQRIAVLNVGDELEVKANIRYRPDKRFVSTQDSERNPFMAQFVVMEVLSTSGAEPEEDDPFDGV